MSGKPKRLILLVVVAALLPANFWLIFFYWETRSLAEKKMELKTDPSCEYRSLDPHFAIVSQKGKGKDDFWCIHHENYVNIDVRGDRIRSIAGLSPKDIFHWTATEQNHYLLVGGHDLYDFNRDFIFDYLQTLQNKFIQVKGEWLPAKEVQLAPVATALLKDGRTFVWQKSVWIEKKP